MALLFSSKTPFVVRAHADVNVFVQNRGCMVEDSGETKEMVCWFLKTNFAGKIVIESRVNITQNVWALPFWYCPQCACRGFSLACENNSTTPGSERNRKRFGHLPSTANCTDTMHPDVRNLEFIQFPERAFRHDCGTWNISYFPAEWQRIYCELKRTWSGHIICMDTFDKHRPCSTPETVAVLVGPSSPRKAGFV